MPGLLPGIAELIVFPVTALSGDTEPCADSFVLDEVGVIYLMTIREWATHAPAAAAPGIARTIAHFVGQVLADASTDIARTLQGLRDEQVTRARAVLESVVSLHPLPHHRTGWERTGAVVRTHSVRTGAVVRPSSSAPRPSMVRATVHPVRLHSVGGVRTGAVGARAWCATGGRLCGGVGRVEAVRFSLT
ncbi:hypothetical protein G3I77_37810 [Streptomyces sp. D2-8]|uniref:hypothetical protein n=1 Tax=Streptomyces sp. D2-8 TaxID=2707767 RepID=UPI0020BD5B55|nr:hypothetical protein [Streptomyces sp. D2-8]MCK8438542.1 hypothetical protein [Streptomyces sp. D2-8]